MARLARPASEMRSQYDAVVIGSGYGGGVTASRLARAGLKVAVLERGKEMLPGEFPAGLLAAQNETQISAHGKRIGKANALFDVRLGRDVHALVGCGVGGTSLINANVCLNPDNLVFEDDRWPLALRTDHFLGVGFHRAREMLAPEVLPATSTPLKFAALAKAAQAMGREAERVPLHITFTSRTNRAGVRQPACTECGDCMGGCNVGAKTTVHSTYLTDAVNFGAEIYEGATVRFVERTREGPWRVAYQAAGDDNIVPRRSVVAAVVVVAAGTLGSNEIMMRSRERGLKLSNQLGTRISTNADAVAFGYNNNVPVNAIGVGFPARAKVPPPGPAVCGLIDLRRRREPNERLAVVEASVQSAMASVLPFMLPAGAALTPKSGPDKEPAAQPTKSLREIISDAKTGTEALFAGAYAGPVHNTQVFLAVGHDSGTGEIVLKGNHVELNWPDALADPVFAAIDATLTKIVAATGGQYVPNPVSNRFLGGKLFTVHPLGGCAMGEDRTRGVVDHMCRVFDGDPGKGPGAIHEGLFVCDGSVMPRSLGVHPLLTITAVAERAMLLFARERGLTLDDSPKSDAPIREFVAIDPPKSGWRRHWRSQG